MKPIAVIILNWNGVKLLKTFLPSVVENTDSNIADIIIADNGSTDESIEYIKEHYPNLKIIAFPENYGFAEGYNKAIEQTQYKYTVLLNSDVAPEKDWLRPLYDYCEANPETAACQPKICASFNRCQFEYAGASGGFIDSLGYPYCRGRVFDTTEMDEGQYDSIIDIFWASGAALFIRTEVYREVGGLDPHFFAHMEEIDLCWRVHLFGKKIKVIPASIVYHLGGGSLPASNSRKTYLNFRNNLLLLHKNLPQELGSKILFKRMSYDALAWLNFMLHFDISNANAIVKAHRDFKKMRKNYTNFPKKSLLGVFPGTERNIVKDYFIRRKKRF